ncbi:hypothetical protein [Herbinix luporum]|jgi:Cdc6-like AAA superfamily ATPase|uniref:Nephrocystin 3-like N-terminal domain-containing protein n=1 Tax=Herbinix luporum TaxID=1679721 RepID=A0A0K8J594_9FIRM|nr:hypothetical protein [Herbinix luporum]CUH92513.1 hypothetical protein SD1D_0966 [Herbinix luporum]HHT57114.1 hypothetical protein [Herbinix luporum]
MSAKKNIRFLLGSNTKQGFVSLFDQLRDPRYGKRLYIIKGGPGSGKSSLMKRVIKTLLDKNHELEYIHCASDPKSLDAFIDHDAKVAMVDGTAPHIMDPRYPGAYDLIINMADCWEDSKLIKSKMDIISLSDTISSCHNTATSYIQGAATLLDNNLKIASGYIKQSTINDITNKILKELEGSNLGKEKKRLLSAVSVGETVFFGETISELAKTVYVINDIWGAASGLLLSNIYQTAAAKGFEQIVCYCSIRTPKKIDHIIFPSAAIAITTANDFHKFQGSKQDILIEDLMDTISKSDQEQMTLNLKNAKELIDTGTKHIKKAKLLHDDLEAYYIEAMDFSKVDHIYDKIIKEIV